MKSTITLDEKEVKLAVKEYLEKRGKKVVGAVTIEVGYQEKDRPWDPEGPYFGGAISASGGIRSIQMQKQQHRSLIERVGLEPLNSLTKYPSILTLHKLGERGRLVEELTSKFELGTPWRASEKVNGANVRIIVFPDGSYVVGARDVLLHASGDMIWDPTQFIMESLTRLGVLDRLHPDMLFTSGRRDAWLFVIYGELYGGKIGQSAKEYGADAVGYRLFDVVEYRHEDIVRLYEEKMEPGRIAAWREQETEDGMTYGQRFLSREDVEEIADNMGLECTPALPNMNFYFSHREGIYNLLQNMVPTSKAVLTDKARGNAEGIVLVRDNPRRMLKLRLDDYARTLDPARNPDLAKQLKEQKK